VLGAETNRLDKSFEKGDHLGREPGARNDVFIYDLPHSPVSYRHFAPCTKKDLPHSPTDQPPKKRFSAGLWNSPGYGIVFANRSKTRPFTHSGNNESSIFVLLVNKITNFGKVGVTGRAEKV
jgi:hypothetical protein